MNFCGGKVEVIQEELSGAQTVCLGRSLKTNEGRRNFVAKNVLCQTSSVKSAASSAIAGHHFIGSRYVLYIIVFCFL